MTNRAGGLDLNAGTVLRGESTDVMRCGKCQKYLPQSAWVPYTWRRRGGGYCRACATAYNKSLVKVKTGEQKKKLSVYTRIRRRDRVEMVQRIKAERGCLYCGETHPAALDFHHRDAAEKSATVRQLCDSAASVDAILLEVAKCDCVCANCHRKLHYIEGVTAYWGDKQYDADVIQEAEVMRERRIGMYPVVSKLA